VGARYELAHGVANGILLPFVMNFNGLVCRREYAAIAQVFGVSREMMTERQQCDAGVMAVQQLLADIGLPGSLAAAGARPEHFAEIATAALQDICIVDNPRRVTETDIIQLLQQASGS
jgi:alcohol dehydrogenase